MRTIHVLPDGGELVINGRDALVDVGDRRIPKVVVYRHPGDTTRPACEVRLEVWDGVPVVADVKLAARREDGVAIRPRDIKLGPAVNLEGRIAGWLAEVAYRPEPAPAGRRRSSKGSPVSDAERRHVARVVGRARRQTRRRLTTGQLRQVAEMYRTAIPPKHEAIALAFDVQPRQAQRYIEKAREAGLLPKSGRDV